MIAPNERQDVVCPDCGRAMLLRPSRYGLFYGCTGYPACKGTHGAHPDGRPLGVPADRETKAARIRAHAAFDAIWKDPTITKRHAKRRRGRAYRWLAEQLAREEVHMGEMSIAECDRVIEVCSGVRWVSGQGPVRAT